MDAADDLAIESWHYWWQSLGRSEGTFVLMAPEVRRFALQLGKPLESATRLDCQRYVGERLKVSDNCAAAAHRGLRSFYEWMLDDGEIEVSPMAKLRRPRVHEAPVRTASEDTFERVLSTCAGARSFWDARDGAILQVLNDCAMRRTELSLLTLDDVDLANGTMLVRRTKSGKPRVVPIGPASKVWLSKYLRKRARHTHAARPELWIGRGGAMTSDAIRKRILKRAEIAGVKLSSHDLRRGFSVAWLIAGGSQTSLQQICGWKDGRMVSRYTRAASTEVAIAEYRRLVG